MPIKPIKYVVVWLLFAATCCFAQTSNLKIDVQNAILHYSQNSSEHGSLQKIKKPLEKYSQTEVANELMSGLPSEQGMKLNLTHDNKVRELYKNLELPPQIICDALEHEQSPHRKWRLMRILGTSTSPRVIETLLHQMEDKRVALEFHGDSNGQTVHGLRVCDEACNFLVYNLAKKTKVVSFETPLEDRDGIIESTLNELHLKKER